MKEFTDLTDFINIHEGRRCFIIGAGPSVAFQKMSVLSKDIIISVNSSILLVDWLSGECQDRYWISNDTLCMQWDYFWSHVLKAKCQKLVRTSWLEFESKFHKNGFRFFKPRKSQQIPLINHGLSLCGVSSVPTAINFALLTGCKLIYILGMDHIMLHGKSHFWQFWPKDKWPQRKSKGRNFRPEQKHQIQMFSENIDVYKSLKEMANRLDVKIYNCSSMSAVEAFDKCILSDII